MKDHSPDINPLFESKIRYFRKYLLKGKFENIALFSTDEIEELIEYCEESGRFRDAFSLVQILLLIDKMNPDSWFKRVVILQNLL